MLGAGEDDVVVQGSQSLGHAPHVQGNNGIILGVQEEHRQSNLVDVVAAGGPLIVVLA